MSHPMVARASAAQATMDAFLDQPFSWKREVGKDCVRLAAFDLKQLGYKPRLSRGGSYSTALGARKALKRAGYANIEAALDDLGLARMPWAHHLPGDIVALPSDEDWPALGVVVARETVLAFSPHTGLCQLAKPPAEDIRILWSARPCLKQL